MSTQSTSIQLPDLLALVRSFQLDTNRWCRPVTIASEKWVLGEEKEHTEALLAVDECKSLHATKVGLLAALCFPTLDAPQLRLITDFITLLIYSNFRVFYSKDGASNPWLPCEAQEQRGLNLLKHHALLQHVVHSIVLLTSHSPPDWEDRLLRYVQEYKSAQLDVIEKRFTGCVPSMQEYIHLRQKMIGLHVVFEVLELLEGFSNPNAPPNMAETLAKLKNLALDIICLTLDIFSYNIDQYNGNKYNIVTVLMTSNGLSIQGAMNQVGAMVKAAFASFSALEDSLSSAQLKPTSGTSYNFSIASWVREALIHDHEIVHADIETFIRRLKYCIVGVINWGYESELYFGNKGEEIRAFGWIFLNAAAPL